MKNDSSCPNCGHIDCVQSMPAIASTGVSTVRGSGTYAGVGISTSGAIIPVLGGGSSTGIQTTALAAATRPVPPSRSLAGPAAWGVLPLIPVLLIVIGVVAIVVDNSTSTDQPGRPIDGVILLGVFATLPFVVLSLIAFLILVDRARANARIARGLPAATALWSAAFYCHRCGLCFWPNPPADGIAAKQPLSPQQFQQVIWTAGRYHGSR